MNYIPFKKSKHYKSLLTILGGAFLCIVFLASCKNFLNAGEVKNQIEEAIDIANSKPVTIYAIADDGTGQVSPSQFEVKRKDVLKIMYTPADSWHFVKWEVINHVTKEVVENAVEFEDETALQTKATILVPQDDLIIHPKVIPVPQIISVSPSTDKQSSANEAIVIEFNVPVEAPDVTPENSIFNLDNISIKNGSNSVAKYFEAPYFNAEKTILTIAPKPEELSNYIEYDQKVSYIGLEVSFSGGILITNDDYTLSLKQNKYTNFSVCYKKDIEKTKPEKIDFKAYKNSNATDCFDLSTISVLAADNNKLLKNRSSGKIYLYGKFKDRESGVKTITVKETHYADKNAEEILYDEFYKKDYIVTHNNPMFTINSDTVEFFIDYDIQSGSGAVNFDITVKDACGNSFVVDTFSVIHITEENYEHFELYNLPYPASSSYYWTGDCNFNRTLYEENVKNIKLMDNTQLPNLQYSFHQRVYGTLLLDYSKLNINASYIHGSGEIKSEPMDHGADEISKDGYKYYEWSHTLNVDSVAGLKVTVTVTDDINSTVSKDFYFPREPEIIKTKSSINVIDLDNGIGGYFSYATLYYKTATAIYMKNGLDDRFNPDKDHWIIPSYGILPVPSESLPGKPLLFGEISKRKFKTTGEAQNNGNAPTVKDGTTPTLVSYPKTGQIGLKFTVDWGEYDYMNCYFAVDKETTHYGKRKYISKANNESTVTILVDEDRVLEADTLKLELNGFKKSSNNDIYGKGSEKQTYPISLPSKADFDTKGPVCLDDDVKRLSLEKYQITITDLSGVSEAWFIDSNDKNISQITPDSTNGFVELEVPAHLFEEAANADGIYHIKMKDTNDNTSVFSKSLPATVPGYERIEKTTKNGSYFTSCEPTYVYYATGSGEVAWTKIDSTDKQVKITPELEEKFLRLFKIPGTNVLTSCKAFSTPQYFFTGTPSSGSFDYMLPNNNDSVLVNSDKVALVYTVVTSKPYDECVKWDMEKWERNQHILNVRLMSLNGIPQKYSIPVVDDGDDDDDDYVKQDECYAVIVHFANNTSVMSSVMVKE